MYDRLGTCLYYGEWNRTKTSDLPKDEEFKLMYGMLFSMKSFIARMSPTDQKDGFLNLQTSKYKLHFYETPSGHKFILNTDLNVGDIRETLHTMYKDIFVEYVVKNPLCSLNEPLTSDLFKSKMDEYVRGLPVFAS